MILDLQDAEPDNATELQTVDRRGGLPVRIENRVADPGCRLPGRRRLLAAAGGIVGNQGRMAHKDPSFSLSNINCLLRLSRHNVDNALENPGFLESTVRYANQGLL